MLGWKVILEVICTIIVAVLILFFVIPSMSESMGLVHPVIYEMEEEIRCHLFQRLGVCLSMYPNPVKKGKEVEVTFRARRWYENKEAYIAEKFSEINVGEVCEIVKGRCKTKFTAPSESGDILYFAFIDIKENGKWDEGADHRGEEKFLKVR